jgi:hypothetical protein
MLYVSTVSTAAATNGFVRLQMAGNHTGNGVQVDDVTTAGTAMAINANALTSGSALSVVSSATGLTGDLGKFEASGNNAGVSGNAFKIGMTGASATGTALTITQAGSGYALRISDDGTYSDTTPLVVDSLGRVGIGTAGPSASLDIVGQANMPAIKVSVSRRPAQTRWSTSPAPGITRAARSMPCAST